MQATFEEIAAAYVRHRAGDSQRATDNGSDIDDLPPLVPGIDSDSDSISEEDEN